MTGGSATALLLASFLLGLLLGSVLVLEMVKRR